MKPIFDSTIHSILNDKLKDLEDKFDAHVIFYYGSISDGLTKPFRDLVEDLQSDDNKNRLMIVLNSPGGSAEVVEQLVNLVRHHYEEVNFIVPDAAYSAGTIFCMSGDNIYMDYSSSLGPIDPQVQVAAPNGQYQWIPALGYLDKVNELIEKSRKGEITNAELMLLQQQDIAMLRRYEQAKELTIALLKKWLVKYKFKNWDFHQSNPDKKGERVTEEEKEKRAEEIANILSENSEWHSHGRSINIETLKTKLKLKIEDYSEDGDLTKKIRDYNDLITEYIRKNGYDVFIHSRNFI
jgi:membrane-bound ClpP family serine protease